MALDPSYLGVRVETNPEAMDAGVNVLDRLNLVLRQGERLAPEMRAESLEFPSRQR